MRRAVFVLASGLLACAKPNFDVRPDVPPLPVAPAGVTHTSETIPGAVPRFAQAWRPAGGEPRAVLVVMHGLRDHSDRYAAFAARLVERGYAVYAFDLRGHGRSAGGRVTIDSFDDYLADFNGFVAGVRAREAGRPLFVFGHSMGGAIVLLWSERHPEVSGTITSAPAIRIDTLPFAAAGSIVAAAVTPNFGGLAPDNKGFSTDPGVEAEMGRDPLIYQPPGPVHTAAALISAIEQMWAGVDRLTVPLLLLHGTADTLTAPAGSRELYARAASKDKTLRLYAGQAHDLVHEPMHDAIIGDVIAWLDAHTGGGPAASFPAPDVARRLRGDAHRPSVSFSFEGIYRNYDQEVGATNYFGAGLRLRYMPGHRLVWPAGLDIEILPRSTILFRLAANLAGVGYVAPNGNSISMAAGAGIIGGQTGSLFEIPVALDAEVQAGRVRLLLWGRVAWFPTRDLGEGPPIGDDIQLGAAVRLGGNHRFWSTANAGAGPYIGVTWERLIDLRAVGVVLGLHMWGGS